MDFTCLRTVTRSLLLTSAVFVGPLTSGASPSPQAVSSDTTKKFISEKFGFAFSPPPSCTVKVSYERYFSERGYFQLEGRDDPQFGGHAQDLNACFRDFDYAQELAQGKVTFKTLAESKTAEMYEGIGDRATTTGRVDSVRVFKSRAGLEVVIVYITQVVRIYEGASVDTSGKENRHLFVVWVDISHDGKYFALILDPYESQYARERAMTRSMYIVNSLTLIPFKRDR